MTEPTVDEDERFTPGRTRFQTPDGREWDLTGFDTINDDLVYVIEGFADDGRNETIMAPIGNVHAQVADGELLVVESR